jgi:hypothetical protein
MRSKLVFAVLLVASVVWTTPARATASGCDGTVPTEPAPLCGTTTISGTSPGYVLVSVPDGGLVLDDANIHIDGAGPFVGMMLTSAPPYLTAPDCGLAGNGQLITMCPNGQIQIRGLISEPFGGAKRFQSIGTGFCSRCDLEAGTYRLYLLTSGAPVTVSMTFPDASGSIALFPGNHVFYDSRIPDPALEPTGVPVYGAGFTGTLPTPGIEFGVVIATTNASAATSTGLCFYLDDPGDPRVAYQPGCPGTSDGFDLVFNHVLPITSGSGMIGYAYPFDVGSAGVGGWTADAGAGTKSYVSVSQLGFDPA